MRRNNGSLVKPFEVGLATALGWGVVAVIAYYLFKGKITV